MKTIQPIKRRAAAMLPLALLSAVAVVPSSSLAWSNSRPDVDPLVKYPHSANNAGFEQNSLAGWQIGSGSGQGGTWSASSLQHFAGSYSAKFVDSDPSKYGVISTTVPVATQTPPIFAPSSLLERGEKAAFGVWFYSSSVQTNGTVFVRIQSDFSSTTAYSAWTRYNTANLPLGQWVYLPVEPVGVAGTDYFPSDPAAFGRVLYSGAQATSLTFIVRIDADGTFFLDDAGFGKHEYVEFGLQDQSFESGLVGGTNPWKASGEVSVSSPGTLFANSAYYGLRYATLHRSPHLAGPKLWQTISIGGGSNAPKHQLTPEACAWIRTDSDVSTGGYVKLTIRGKNAANQATDLATSTYTPTANGASPWLFLQASGAAPIPFSYNNSVLTQLEVRVESTLEGTVWVDFVQLGERHGVNGNPKRFVIADMIPKFRSKPVGDLSDLAYPGFGSPLTWTVNQRSQVWRLWYSHYSPACLFTDPPTCSFTDPSWGCPGPADACFSKDEPWPRYFFQHDPGLLDAGCDRRMNGRRDLAISTDNPVSVVAIPETRCGVVKSTTANTEGFNDIPLIGAYSSRDPEVIDFQIQLAKAVGVDAFGIECNGYNSAKDEFDNYGPLPADPAATWPLTWAPAVADDPRAPNIEISMAAIFAEADKTDFKVFPFMVLDQYFGDNTSLPNPCGGSIIPQGWLKLCSDAEQKTKIEEDLETYARWYFQRKCTLKVNGSMVIGIFFQRQLMQSGANLSTAWHEIISHVNGDLALDPEPEKIALLGSRFPGQSLAWDWINSPWESDFGAFVPWHQVDPESRLHKYPSLQAFSAGTATGPACAVSDWEAVGAAWVNFLTNRVQQWEAADDANHLAIGLLSSDFDNSGITGRSPALSDCNGASTVCNLILSENVVNGVSGGPKWLERHADANHAQGIDWILMATWNAWPEFTQVEPMWRQSYFDAIRGTHTPDEDPNSYLSPADFDAVFGRLNRLRAQIAVHKAVTLPAQEVYRVVGQFMESAAGIKYN